MNGAIAQSIRSFGKLAKPLSKKTFKSCLLVTLNQSGKVNENHPMDTNLKEYYRVMNEIVIPDCMSIAPTKAYEERIKKFVSYINPAFHDCWNFAAEHIYRIVAPQEHQTEENLTKTRILRACCELTFNMAALVDDLSDGGLQRRGKPTWHTICEGGIWAGMYDTAIVGSLPFHVLRKNFRDHPGYLRMLEAFGTANLKMLIGQNIDFLELNKELSVMEGESAINPYKAGHVFVVQPICALTHAGVMDDEILTKAEEIYVEFGNLVQVWDDFNDWYSNVEATGKPAMDNINGGKTWATVTAMHHFDPMQKNIFKDCYIATDPDKRETVKKLLDEIDLPQHYINHMREAYLRITPMIEAIPHTRVQKACYSHMEWLIGDVCDPLPIL